MELKIIKRLRYYTRVAFCSMRMSLQTTLEYPVNLIGWCLANPIQFIIGFATIKFVVEQFGTLHGWNYEQLAFLYGMAVLSHGLSVILFIQTWFIGNLVIQGGFDVFRLRPMNILFQFLFRDFNIIGISDLIPGAIVFAYGCLEVHFNWSLANSMELIGAVIGATLIRGAVYLFCGSISFWTKSSNYFVGFCLEIFDRTTMYPLSIYPKMIQILFTIILPLGWISYYPSSSFLGIESGMRIPIGIPVMTFGIGLLVFILACLVFCKGMRRYESAGS